MCSLVKVGAGFKRVSVCLMNPTGKEVQLGKCILAGAFIPAWTSEGLDAARVQIVAKSLRSRLTRQPKAAVTYR